MKCLENFFMNFDFMGDQIGLEHKRSTRFKSLAGGIYSMIIVLISGVIGALFSRELFTRKNPLVVLSREAVQNSVVNLGDFPVAIAATVNTNPNDLPFELFTIDLVSLDVSANGVPNRVVHTDVLEKCSPNNMTFPNSNQTRELFNFTLNSGMYCLKDPSKYYFRNQYSTPNSAFLNFRFQKCSKLSNPNCPDNLDQIMPSIFFGIYFINSYVDSSNYENPIIYRIESVNSQMTPGLLKRYYLRITSNNYESDNGWILESNVNYNFNSFDSSAIDIATETTYYEGHLLWITLESPALLMNYKRSYKKVQDFIANVGGFANMLRLIFLFSTKVHLRFLYINFIRNLTLQSISITSPPQLINKDDSQVPITNQQGSMSLAVGNKIDQNPSLDVYSKAKTKENFKLDEVKKANRGKDGIVIAVQNNFTAKAIHKVSPYFFKY